MQVTVRAIVVLPAPFAPMMPTRSPAEISRLIPRSACAPPA
jgi:hypothetical protein